MRAYTCVSVCARTPPSTCTDPPILPQVCGDWRGMEIPACAFESEITWSEGEQAFMIHQIAKGAWTYDSSVNKGPEICWQLVLCPSPKQLALAREKLCEAGWTLAERAQEQWFLCSLRSQGLVLQTRASWIPVIIKGSSAQVKESVIRLSFVSYLQGFDVPVVFLWPPQGMLLPFSHFILFFDSELCNGETSTIFFIF